jgi:hypothetical protein
MPPYRNPAKRRPAFRGAEFVRLFRGAAAGIVLSLVLFTAGPVTGQPAAPGGTRGLPFAGCVGACGPGIDICRIKDSMNVKSIHDSSDIACRGHAAPEGGCETPVAIMNELKYDSASAGVAASTCKSTASPPQFMGMQTADLATRLQAQQSGGRLAGRLMNSNPGDSLSRGSADSGMKINTTRAWILGVSLFTADVAIMGYYFATYYNPRESERSKWHTFNDWYNADLNFDKLGHVFATQMYSNAMYHMLRWTNMSEGASMIWSSSAAFVFQAEMETTDGFYKKWGWSWWDIGANAVGAAWPNLQRLWKPLQSVNIKMSWHPSPNFKKKWQNNPVADYDGCTCWLTLAVNDVLPRSLKPYWPDWLGIAVGYGTANTMVGKEAFNNDSEGHGAGDQEWYLAFDYDIRGLFGDSPFMHFLKEALNLIHLPAPAVRLSPSGIWYGLYF